jgi:hypothetical protein
MPSLPINDDKVKDPEVIADAFNIFFLTITENLNLHQEVRGDAISFLKQAFPRKFPGIKTISTTETEIKSIIHSLKAENASGYDGITSKILKVCASLLTGLFADHLKISGVRPLYKRKGTELVR